MKMNKTRSCFSEINKIDKNLARLFREKKDKNYQYKRLIRE